MAGATAVVALSGSRVSRAERALNVDPGLLVQCPKCGGSGQVMMYGPGEDQTDTGRAGWVVRQRVHEIRIRLAVEAGKDPPPPFGEPEPPGHPGRCPLCRGTGSVGEATVRRREAEAEADPWLQERMRQAVESLGTCRIVDRGEPSRRGPSGTAIRWFRHATPVQHVARGPGTDAGDRLTPTLAAAPPGSGASQPHTATRFRRSALGGQLHVSEERCSAWPAFAPSFPSPRRRHRPGRKLRMAPRQGCTAARPEARG